MGRLVAALLVVLTLPAVAVAQSAGVGERTRLPVEIRRGEAPPEARHGRLLAPPAALSPAAVGAARRAAEALEQARRDEELLRAQTSPFARRPDLGYDVTSGIQQRSLQRALGR